MLKTSPHQKEIKKMLLYTILGRKDEFPERFFFWVCNSKYEPKIIVCGEEGQENGQKKHKFNTKANNIS